MSGRLKIIECIIDTEIFERLSTYRFEIIDFSPRIIGLKAVIGVVDQKVVACAILDYSRTLPDKIFYEIFYCFDEEVKNIQNEINFLSSKNKFVEKNNGSKNRVINEYEVELVKLEEAKSHFRYNDFYYIVFLESLIKGSHYGSAVVEYIKDRYENIITLPFPKRVSTFWEYKDFKEINYLYYYKKI